ncbi:MAG: M48 family metalloprotease [Thermoplasmata archaeon]|nr:M48 family metalloprotease [Thermoplasmata archaeon]MCI4359036.1 M48 family metalloprotease [Thermoplasmata archaeon]
MFGPRSKTLLLFGAIIALFVVVGGLLGQYVFGSPLAGLIIAISLSLAINLVTYFLCDRLILWSNHARIVREEELPRLARIVQGLAPRFGLVSPRIALVNSETPNAFATGRDDRHAVVAVTVGLLRLLDDRELTGVVAHELAHVKDRDILVMTFAATLAGAISYAAQMVIFSSLLGGRGRGQSASWLVVLLAAVGAPIAAMLIQLAVSRSRESRADAVGAQTTGDPGALADALQKLAPANARYPMTQGSPASSSLFIVNPYGGSWFASLFSTHPPIQDRIARLRAMGRSPVYTVPIRSPIASGAFPNRSGSR